MILIIVAFGAALFVSGIAGFFALGEQHSAAREEMIDTFVKGMRPR